MHRLRVPGLIAATLLLLVVPGKAARAAGPDLDVSAASRPSPAFVASLRRLGSDPALARVGTPAHVDERYGVPSFVWATRTSGGAPAARTRGPLTREQAARDHLGRLRGYYHLDTDDVRDATLRNVHDTGRGPIVVAFRRSLDGVDVFRDEVKILMNRNLDLIAVSGYIPGRAETGRPADRAFRSTAAVAIARALADFNGATVDPGSIRRTGPAPGAYEWHALGLAVTPLPAGVEAIQPIRSKRVLFHLPERLVPSYYVELMSESEATAYVVAAADGAILFRHSLMADDAFTYRVWQDGTPLHIPLDGPQGSAPTPHPTGLPDNFSPSFVPSGLVTLQNGPISTNDPWLAPGATETAGNNVDAYADLAAPDGLGVGDFRASTTSPNTFDRTYDTGQPAGVSSTQQMASVTQLFYTNNFLHDWFYDAGFDEAAGNAQKLNFGRGGVEGDDIRAEAQDVGGTNNANMSTPSDGGRPRMQMYVFHPFTRVRVNTPAGIAGDKGAGRAEFGPQTFSVTGDVVLVNDDSGTPTDACQSIVNSVAGKIALIDRTASDCSYTIKVLNAQAAGAIGAIIASNGPAIATMEGVGGITIPSLMVSQPDGAAIKSALGSGVVNVTLLRALARDGTIDNQIVAHEWGHYISNRLIGDASGLTNAQGRGMGEGWGDFNAILLSVKPEDATAPSGPNYTGVYGMVAYAVHNSLFGTNAYYFGVRRYPYSTEFNRNPLTFQHIQNGVPLPVGPPVAFGQSGAGNAAVHSTGEVWCTMLWECYAALLRRLPFAQASERMREYLVAGMKLTPNAPTFIEARDALLAAAYATDLLDFNDFCGAFARRGAGTGAVGPDRDSNTNVGVTESYVCGGDLQIVSVSLDDNLRSCDTDGYLDEGEIGTFTVTLKNSGTTNLSATTATLSSTNPSVTFPSGASLSFPSSPPFGTTVASCPVRLTGAAGVQSVDIRVHYNDPGLAVAGPRIHDFATRGNVDDVPSANETVEAAVPNWALTSVTSSNASEPWRRQVITTFSHRFHGPDASGYSDQAIVSPPLFVGAGTFSFAFKHTYSFEASADTYWDGGVIEITDDGGGSWTDIGASILPGYDQTLDPGNLMGSRPAFAGTSPGFPAYTIAVASFGTAYAGKTVHVRFRVGTDGAVGGAGWFIDDLEFTGLTNQPFLDVIADPGPCAAVAVEEETVPRELAFVVAGANPSAGAAEFRFALPQPARVQITIHDIAGRRVATIVDRELPAGRHSAAWDAQRGFDGPPPGVYFARLTANGQRITRRLVVLPH